MDTRRGVPHGLWLHRECREPYRRWIADRGIDLRQLNGWQRFIFEASRSPDGWEALRAHKEQKRIERQAEGKFKKLEELFAKHVGEEFSSERRRQHGAFQ